MFFCLLFLSFVFPLSLWLVESVDVCNDNCIQWQHIEGAMWVILCFVSIKLTQRVVEWTIQGPWYYQGRKRMLRNPRSKWEISSVLACTPHLAPFSFFFYRLFGSLYQWKPQLLAFIMNTWSAMIDLYLPFSSGSSQKPSSFVSRTDPTWVTLLWVFPLGKQHRHKFSPWWPLRCRKTCERRQSCFTGGGLVSW